jgi:acylphosphatase
MPNRRLRAVIRGSVQGVGFRYFAEHRALRAGLRGFVRNAPDGAVEVEAEGPSDQLEQFLDALRQGPRSAQVEQVDVSWSPYRGDLPSFSVRF